MKTVLWQSIYIVVLAADLCYWFSGNILSGIAWLAAVIFVAYQLVQDAYT